MDISLRKLSQLKIRARKLGNVTIGGHVETIQRFWKEEKLYLLDYAGKQWEIAVFFVLGVMQSSMKGRGINFWINSEPDLDAMQIDLEIDGHPIQLKFGWSQVAAETEQYRLSHRGITVVNAPLDSDGIEVFRDILSAAGFSEAAIEAEIYENPGFDAAEEIFEWFVKGIAQ